jgi:hypothetical protein
MREAEIKRLAVPGLPAQKTSSRETPSECSGACLSSQLLQEIGLWAKSEILSLKQPEHKVLEAWLKQ